MAYIIIYVCNAYAHVHCNTGSRRFRALVRVANLYVRNAYALNMKVILQVACTCMSAFRPSFCLNGSNSHVLFLQ